MAGTEPIKATLRTHAAGGVSVGGYGLPATPGVNPGGKPGDYRRAPPPPPPVTNAVPRFIGNANNAEQVIMVFKEDMLPVGDPVYEIDSTGGPYQFTGPFVEPAQNVWPISFGGANVLIGDSVTIPVHDPGLRTASGGWVEAGVYQISAQV